MADCEGCCLKSNTSYKVQFKKHVPAICLEKPPRNALFARKTPQKRPICPENPPEMPHLPTHSSSRVELLLLEHVVKEGLLIRIPGVSALLHTVCCSLL